MLDLQGVTVRAEIIIEKGGDYCFPVKANQPTLLADLKLFFDADPDGQTKIAGTTDIEGLKGKFEWKMR